jgi:hypothetical protein
VSNKGWGVIAEEEAGDELASFDSYTQNIIRSALNDLRLEDDPRFPARRPALDVKHLEHDAPGWFRVKFFNRHIRVIYRLLRLYSDELDEYRYDEVPWDGDHENVISIVQVCYRDDMTYRETRRRYRRTTR